MYLFQELEKKAKGISFKDRKQADLWYRSQASKMSGINREKVMASAGSFKTFTTIGPQSIGKMYMYFYDPKHKDTLPFYDIFPLVFPIQIYDDGFLGINLHYLPPQARGKLMNALYTIANNNKYNASMKLNISYNILKQSAKKFGGFENCIKRYLFSHVRSSFQFVNANDWDKALLLPLQKWVVNRGRPPS